MNESSRGRVRVERSHKRVRAYLDGDLVVDSSAPRLVWESPHYPTYYLPLSDMRAELVPTGEIEHSPSRGEAMLQDVKTARATAPGAAARFPESPLTELHDLVRLDWKSMSEWFEEDEPVYTHPRDPYTRVDILASSRHVRIEIDGVTVADSVRPHILFETGLPSRYYLPMTDVRLDLLRPTASESMCPYKGTAGYFSVDVAGSAHEDVGWIYRSPLAESQKIAGLVAFYNERVDIFLDGEPLERPRTRFGRSS
jgi:uncharacterized protein (DUF427 family)